MLVKDLLNWKELDDEQKAATKKKLADAAKIGAGFAAGVGAVCLGYKVVEKIYPNVEFVMYKGAEPGTAYYGLERETKSGKKSPFSIHRGYLSTDVESAKAAMTEGVDFYTKAIADFEADKFNDAVTEALD